MKKLLLTLIFVMFLALPMQAEPAWTTGSGDQTFRSHAGSLYELNFNWTSDASGDSVATSDWSINGYICKVITNPGPTAPTADYDITLTNEDGVDVVHGVLADRHTTTSEEIIPVPGDNATVYGCSIAIGRITLNVSNAGNAKNGKVTVIFSREKY